MIKTATALFLLLCSVLLCIDKAGGKVGKDDASLCYPSYALRQGKHIFSLNLNNLSIPLLGLGLKGTVNLISFSPLVLDIDAEKVRFDIARFKRFLLHHHCMDHGFKNKIPDIEANGSHVKIYINTTKRQFLFYSDLLELENSQIKGLGFVLLEDGSFRLVFKSASIEISLLKRLINKIYKNPLSLPGIKELKADGRLIILPSQMSGTLRNIKEINGSFKLKGDHIRLIARSNNTSQTFLVDQLDAGVILKDGTPTITLAQTHICSLPKGSAEINGVIKGIPVNFYETGLACSFDSFRVFDSALDASLLKKRKKRSISLALSLRNPSVLLSLKGRITPKKEDIYIKIYRSYLNLFDKVPKDTQFKLDTISSIRFSSEISIDFLSINNLIRLDHILLHTKPTKKGLVFAGKAKVSDMNISLTGLVDPSANIASQVEFKGTDIDLTSFIASFSKELPVFLKGRLYLSGNLFIHGDSLSSIFKGSMGDIVATIDSLFVYRISRIDPRLGFFLDMLRIAGIKPQQEDSLLFKKCVVKGILKEGNLFLERFVLTGSPISVLANGTFFINKKRLSMTGSVKTGIGIKKHLKIDRYLRKENR